MAPLFRDSAPLIRTGFFNRGRLLAIVLAAALFAGGATFVGNVVLDRDKAGSSAGPTSEQSPRLGPDELRDAASASGGAESQVADKGAGSPLDSWLKSASELGSKFTDTIGDVVDAVVSTAGEVSESLVATARDTGGKILDTVLRAGDGVSGSVGDGSGSLQRTADSVPATAGVTRTASEDVSTPKVAPDPAGALRPGSTTSAEEDPPPSTDSASRHGADDNEGVDEDSSDDSSDSEGEPEESPSPDPSESPTEEPTPEESPSETPDEEPSPSPSESPSP